MCGGYFDLVSLVKDFWGLLVEMCFVVVVVGVLVLLLILFWY